MESMRVAVIGAGGIGGFIAGALAKAHVPVTVIARGQHLEAICERGLHVRSAALGAFHVRPDAYDDPKQARDATIVLCTFKAHQWDELLPKMGVFRETGATVVTLQNGVPFWFADPPLQAVDPGGRLAAAFAPEQLVGAVVHSSGEIVEPGVVKQSGRVLYPLGDPEGGVGSRAHAVIDVLRLAGLDAQGEANIRARIWAKLVNNASLNPVSAICGLTVHAMLADPVQRQRVAELMGETIAVGGAYGVAESLSVDGQFEVASHIADVKTSMLQDREAGRALELDPILGAVIELGQRAGVPTPGLRAAYAELT